MLSLRSRWKIAVFVNQDWFCMNVSPSFQDHTSKLVRNRDTRNNYYYRFASLKAIKWSFFYHGRQQSFYQYLFLEQSAHTCFFQCSSTILV